MQRIQRGIIHVKRGRARKTKGSVVFLQQTKKGLQLIKLKWIDDMERGADGMQLYLLRLES
jgi:hypothetical protein